MLQQTRWKCILWLYIYIYIYMKTMCPPGYHLNGFVATYALGYMMYGLMTIYIYIYIYIYILETKILKIHFWLGKISLVHRFLKLYFSSYIYIYTYLLYTYYICIYAYTHRHTDTHIYIYMYHISIYFIYTYIYIHIHKFIWKKCKYMCIYVYIM